MPTQTQKNCSFPQEIAELLAERLPCWLFIALDALVAGVMDHKMEAHWRSKAWKIRLTIIERFSKNIAFRKKIIGSHKFSLSFSKYVCICWLGNYFLIMGSNWLIDTLELSLILFSFNYYYLRLINGLFG